MVIVDTTVWIDYLGGFTNAHTSCLDRELAKQHLGLTDLVLCEVLQGIRDDATFTQVRRQLSKFQLFSTGGSDLAVASAQNYRSLRRRGFTARKTIDCLIATFCIDAKHWLLHRNHDFDPFEKLLGLQVVHP
jgi:predicted nucleic acid-binding protein